MQILLACAKIMNETTEIRTPFVSKPRFLKEAEHFALLMSQRSVEELMDMFQCSRQLAIENKLRYERFFADNESLPAILAYYGQAYKCLNASTLNNNDLLFAQRMEGKLILENQTMFKHWKPLLTDLLIDSVKADDGILVHLATEEMQHLFDWKKVLKEVSVIQPQFLVMKNVKLKSVTVYAKSCRGAMTRFIIKNKLESPENLVKFEYDGFEFKSSYGDRSHPHFIID